MPTKILIMIHFCSNISKKLHGLISNGKIHFDSVNDVV